MVKDRCDPLPTNSRRANDSLHATTNGSCSLRGITMPSIPILPIEIDPWPFKPMCDDPECWCQRDQDDDEARADQQQEGTDEG